jgi:hypothetical protein
MDEGGEPRLVDGAAPRRGPPTAPVGSGEEGRPTPEGAVASGPSRESSAAELVARQARWLRERARFEASQSADRGAADTIDPGAASPGGTNR